MRTALDLSRDPHIAARGFVETIDHPTFGARPYPGPPWRMTGAETVPHAPAPGLGQHTGEILAELGYDAGAVAALSREGALR